MMFIAWPAKQKKIKKIDILNTLTLKKVVSTILNFVMLCFVSFPLTMKTCITDLVKG